MTDAQGIPRLQLKSIVERVERLEAEIADLNADKSDIYKDARGNGFDVKAIKKVVSRRKLDDNKRVEEDVVFETYWDAIHGTGLVHAHARENIEEFDAETGEILEGESAGTAYGLPTNQPETAPEEAAPHEVADVNSVESVSPQAETAATGSIDANTGGGHVTDGRNAQPDQAGGLVQRPPAKPLRPQCRNPGDHCGGYGSTHCNSCVQAAKEIEVAA